MAYVNVITVQTIGIHKAIIHVGSAKFTHQLFLTY